MSRRAQSGFTLLEVVLALVLLTAMLTMAWSGLTFVLRGWDTGATVGQRTADDRLALNFLRRELNELFPMRWKDALQLKFAFEGEPKHMRFVSSRPSGLAAGGLALVALSVESEGPRTRNLVMRRALPDDAAKDFAPLEKGEATILFRNVDSVDFAYFGSENDIMEPRWETQWRYTARVPQLIRITVKGADGTEHPEFVARVMLGEQAGCLESSFQQTCRPRRP